MYHRFDENKYPSTNIQMNVFKLQIKIIKNLKYNFYDPKNLEKKFSHSKNRERKYSLL